jgi:hypothetical protein
MGNNPNYDIENKYKKLISKNSPPTMKTAKNADPWH